MKRCEHQGCERKLSTPAQKKMGYCNWHFWDDPDYKAKRLAENNQNPEVRAKIKRSVERRWKEDPDFKKGCSRGWRMVSNRTAAVERRRIAALQERHKDPEYQKRRLAALRSPGVLKQKSRSARRYYRENPNAKDEISERTKRQFSNPRARKRHSAISKRKWKDPEYRKRHRKAMNSEEVRRKIREPWLDSEKRREQTGKRENWPSPKDGGSCTYGNTTSRN